MVQRLARLAELKLLEQPVNLGGDRGEPGQDPAVRRRQPRPGSAGPAAAPASAPFSSANLAAFHSLLQKFLAPAAHSSLTATSLPGLAPRARVNRVASAPKRSIQSSGSTVFPRDLDIFLP